MEFLRGKTRENGRSKQVISNEKAIQMLKCYKL